MLCDIVTPHFFDTRPASMLSIDDLPAPDGPMIASDSPGIALPDIPRRISFGTFLHGRPFFGGTITVYETSSHSSVEPLILTPSFSKPSAKERNLGASSSSRGSIILNCGEVTTTPAKVARLRLKT